MKNLTFRAKFRQKKINPPQKISVMSYDFSFYFII